MLLKKSVILPLLFVLFLAGCSGSDGFGLGNGEGGDTEGTDGGTIDDGGTTQQVIPRLGMGSGSAFTAGVLMTSLASGTELSYGGSVTFSASLVDSNDENSLIATPTAISFTSACAEQGLATIGSTATTSAGIATVSYTATSCTGSDTITATLETGSTTLLATTTINISSLDLGTGSSGSFVSGGMLTSLSAGAELSYGGDTVVTVNIVDTKDNSLFTASPVTVNFSSTCVANGKSTIDSSVITSTGTATATYTANTCEGADVITARLSDGTEAVAVISVAGQVLGALEFVSATPSSLSLKGSGSSTIPEVSTLTFSLKDQTGAAMAGKTVNYELSTTVGGIALAQTSSVTNSQGLTSVKLNAGSVNTSVVVTATVTITNLDSSESTTSTTSKPISILGGIPDQDSFSISIDRLNPGGWETDGRVSVVTIRAADRFNNQARDGTQISFVTSGGAIVGACQLAGGTCSVNWTSQDPRPAGGVVRILARSTGEESFIDSNSNGVYDIGETVTTHLDEAFLDVNGSGTRDSDSEFFSDFNNNGVYDTKQNTLYQGAGCSAAAKAAGHCANLVDVRANHAVCMSNRHGVDVDDDSGGFVDLTTGSQTINFQIYDVPNFLTPPTGTNVSIEVEGAQIVSGGEVVIPNDCVVGGFGFSVSVKSTTIATRSGEQFGSLKVVVERADGITEEFPRPVDGGPISLKLWNTAP